MPTLTPTKIKLLCSVGEFGIASLPQLAKLVCPSERAARRHLRALFDAGLLDVVPVSRILLAGPELTNDASLLYGSAPSLYTLTSAGVKLLAKLDMPVPRPPQHYGPRNSLFLGHELAVRDVRVWLTVAARSFTGHRLETWKDGPAATFDPRRCHVPRLPEPDAWFIYRLDQKVIVGLLEYDRGTERGATRWKGKIAGYDALFAGGHIPTVTGYQNARIIVIAPDARRRDTLAEIISAQAPTGLAARFWLAEAAVLSQSDLLAAAWRQAGSEQLRPLISPDLVRPVQEITNETR